MNFIRRLIKNLIENITDPEGVWLRKTREEIAKKEKEPE